MLTYWNYVLGMFSTSLYTTIAIPVIIFIVLLVVYLLTKKLDSTVNKSILWILLCVPFALCIIGTVINYDRYKTEYSICHSEEAKEKNYIYKDGYCYRKFVGYIGVDTIGMIEGENINGKN